MRLASRPHFDHKTILLMAVFIPSMVDAALAAETPKPAAPPAVVSDEPAATTATYGDWMLRCQRLPEGSKPERFCEVAETIQLQGSQSPIVQIALGRLAADKALQATLVLPTNISLPSVVQFGAKDKPRELAWTRCTPGGCFAAASLPDDVVKAWRGASEPGQLYFKDASGREVGFPVSFKGLAQALDALAKEP